MQIIKKQKKAIILILIIIMERTSKIIIIITKIRKRMEKKMNDVVDTINILDDNDRQKVLDTMKENAKNNEQKLRYKRLINLITKGLDKLERQKQIAKQQKLKELEEQKKLIQSGNKIEQNVENVMIKQEPDQKEETQIKEELNEPNKVI